eukprot:1738277-Prymnesium_polylepis.1
MRRCSRICRPCLTDHGEPLLMPHNRREQPLSGWFIALASSIRVERDGTEEAGARSAGRKRGRVVSPSQ